ncbi:uncharacterized protein LOC144935004 [Lampetra fluviatilis]
MEREARAPVVQSHIKLDVTYEGSAAEVRDLALKLYALTVLDPHTTHSSIEMDTKILRQSADDDEEKEKDPLRAKMRALSEEVGPKWRAFARALLVPDHIIDNIHYNHALRDGVAECVYQVLRYWNCRAEKEKRGTALRAALEDIGKKSLIEELGLEEI